MISYHLLHHIILLPSIQSAHISQKLSNAQRSGCKKDDRWTFIFFPPEVPEEELDERSVSRILIVVYLPVTSPHLQPGGNAPGGCVRTWLTVFQHELGMGMS